MSFGIVRLAMPEWDNCECERTGREEVVKETLNHVPMCWVWNMAESCVGRVPEGCFGSGTRATKIGAREEVWHSTLASTLLEQRVWGDTAALLLQQLASAECLMVLFTLSS